MKGVRRTAISSPVLLAAMPAWTAGVDLALCTDSALTEVWTRGTTASSSRSEFVKNGGAGHEL
jgi:hypothetical protein